MRSYFDPRAMLKQSSLPLVRELFRQRGELLDLPWDELRESKQLDLIYHAWQSLPESARREVHAVLQDIWEQADEAGAYAFRLELQAFHPLQEWEFNACGSHLNKSLWFWIHFPRLFERAALFARADNLASGRFAVRRNSFPKTPILVTPQMRGALARALHDYYWPNEMRGRHCHVEHYTRSGGNEYFFAYLDDWPTAHLMFEEEGSLETRSQKFAFAVVFVYCPVDGSLELVARGGKSVHFPLQRAFARAIFQRDIEPANPLQPVYQLQPLLDPEFHFSISEIADVTQARLTRVRLVPLSSTLCSATLEIRFGTRIGRSQANEIMRGQIAALGLVPSQVQVQQAAFQIRFWSQEKRRDRSATFSVCMPHTCDLKSKSNEVRELGEQCLLHWGLRCDN